MLSRKCVLVTAGEYVIDYFSLELNLVMLLSSPSFSSLNFFLSCQIFSLICIFHFVYVSAAVGSTHMMKSKTGLQGNNFCMLKIFLFQHFSHTSTASWTFSKNYLSLHLFFFFSNLEYQSGMFLWPCLCPPRWVLNALIGQHWVFPAHRYARKCHRAAFSFSSCLRRQQDCL